MYILIRGFLTPAQCEVLIADTFAFKKQFYTEENLAAHRTYLADTKDHRTSHAYAVSQNYLEGFTGPLPTINLDSVRLLSASSIKRPFDSLVFVSQKIMNDQLWLNPESRVLFNVQEYYGGSERVPKHMDGELLEFTADAEGNLDIKRTIRPEKVAVLTLVNDTNDGGTRIHFPDGTEEVVRGQAGDLLVFDNTKVYHSVDDLSGTVKRPDGLLRMTIGWRSLADKVFYFDKERGINDSTSMMAANQITETWYKNEWPGQWAKIVAASQKAAF